MGFMGCMYLWLGSLRGLWHLALVLATCRPLPAAPARSPCTATRLIERSSMYRTLACMAVTRMLCMHDYMAVSTRTLTPPTTGSDGTCGCRRSSAATRAARAAVFSGQHPPGRPVAQGAHPVPYQCDEAASNGRFRLAEVDCTVERGCVTGRACMHIWLQQLQRG